MLTDRLSQAGYFRVYDYARGKVWDNNAGAMAAIGSVTTTNASIATTWNAAHVLGTFTLPDSLPNGTYVVALYDIDVGNAADADEPAVWIWVARKKGADEYFSSFDFSLTWR